MKILIAEPLDFNKEQLDILATYGLVEKGPFQREELLKAVRDVDVLIVRLNHQIDKELLEKAANLKFILTPTTGLNHIDISEAEKKNIKIISLKGETEFLTTIPSTAEHTLALMLSLLRKIPAANNQVLKGNWDRDLFKSHNLNSLTLGILGYGRVGRQMADFAKALNMPWKFFDVDTRKKKYPESIEELQSFLSEINVLSIHIPLHDENINYLNASNLKYLKKGSYIINTSRGEIIEERALSELLQNGHLAGLATDVLKDELNPELRNDNPLLKLAKLFDNIIITPHIAGATYESMWLTEEFIIKKWIKFLS
ncbi:NAD(P)-dependent oxidoreductase [Zunongwangia sp. F363]|uniref:NAD(P)-dependent oxidoreductase n=1 Tax=Autumnicola tepida TaxID=3075595 RepID=A0ABU3C9M5_9FLAO|nr:NAD(P)-dependent oxidoreductase [Zunongwangia sp. F363]MDT0643035.1 NAD(P)-dependent oxidoreductase [Zunongwangia sp. F363]